MSSDYNNVPAEPRLINFIDGKKVERIVRIIISVKCVDNLRETSKNQNVTKYVSYCLERVSALVKSFVKHQKPITHTHVNRTFTR